MYISHFGKRMFLEAVKDGGEGNGGEEPVVAVAVTVPPAKDTGSEVLSALNKLVAKQGGERQALEQLFNENYEQRQELRKLKAEKKAYEDVGTLDNIKALAQENATFKRTESLREVAKVAGVNPAILKDLDKGASYEIRKDGEEKVVIVKDSDGTEHPFADYAADMWSAYLPVLYLKGEDVAQQGTPFIRQYAGGAAKPKAGQEALDAVDSYLAKRSATVKK